MMLLRNDVALRAVMFAIRQMMLPFGQINVGRWLAAAVAKGLENPHRYNRGER